MKIKWSKRKNEFLKKTRNISFEQVEEKIANNEILDRFIHPDQNKYPGQYVIVIEFDNYAYIVQFDIDEDGDYLLRTVIPSRMATKKYLGGRNEKKG